MSALTAAICNNPCVECCTSKPCGICCSIWSCVAIGFMIVIGLVQGEALYQKLNGEHLLPVEEQVALMESCFIAVAFYFFCILLCGGRFFYACFVNRSCSLEPHAGGYQTV